MKILNNTNDAIKSVRDASIMTQRAASRTIETTQLASIALVGVCIVSLVALGIAVKALNATK